MRRDLIKEVCEGIREAQKKWDAHENGACRRVRDRVMKKYEELTSSERKEVPEELRVWLRYRSEKYFGKGRKGNGMSSKKSGTERKKCRLPQHAVASRVIESLVGPLALLSSKRGICGVYFGHRVERSELLGDNRRDRFLNQAEEELRRYFDRKLERFEVALDARGTSFQRSVWRELVKIPYGETRSYGDLAENLENPGAVRAVGMANGANPISILVPCHRVIGRDGKLTGFGGGLEIKRRLLSLEGGQLF